MDGTVKRTFTYEAEAFRSYCRRQFAADLDYSFDSVALLDGILAECHASLKGLNETEAWTFLNNMSLAAGSYLGEVLARHCGGHWRVEGNPKQLQNWYVQVPQGPAWPAKTVGCFSAVYHFLQRGPQESLLAVVAPFLNARGQWPAAKTTRPKAATKRSRGTPRRR